MANNLINFGFPEITFTADHRRRLAAVGMRSLKDRFAKGLSASDASAKAYSTKGPIYIPINGGVNSSGRKRTVASLKGRYSLNKKQASTAKQSTGFGQTTPSGQSVKYKDWGQFKQATGHPSHRDLMLSGKMQGAMTEVRNDDSGVEIGFTREEEARKMAGNQANDEMWGWSPNDHKLIGDEFSRIVDEIAASLLNGGSGGSR